MHTAALADGKKGQTAVARCAPAKVNLYLGIHEGRDADGYHRADSLMVSLALHDVVTVFSASDLAVDCLPPAEFPAEKNSAWRAARMLGEKIGPMPDGSPRGAHILIEKSVPEKGGLGGSSTDAAATLLALCELWGVDPEDRRVWEVAHAIGADVAFFLSGAPALLGGRGDETIERFEGVPEMDVVLVRPEGDGVSTVAAYGRFDEDPLPAPGPEAICVALRDHEPHAIAALLFNNLAPAAFALAPETGEVTRWLQAQPGVLGAQLSGSGSCSFAICSDAVSARRIAADARARGWWAAATRTVDSVECC